MNQTNTSTASGKEQGLNLVDMLVFFLSKWKWFLLSVLLFGSLAWLQYARSPLVYFRQATVIIKDPSSKPYTAGGLNRYDNFVNKVNVANELLQFRSKKLMREVVSRVHATSVIRYRTDSDGMNFSHVPPLQSGLSMLLLNGASLLPLFPKMKKKCFFPN